MLLASHKRFDLISTVVVNQKVHILFKLDNSQSYFGPVSHTQYNLFKMAAICTSSWALDFLMAASISSTFRLRYNFKGRSVRTMNINVFLPIIIVF